MGAESTSDLFEERRLTRKFSESNFLRFTILFGSRFCSGMDWLLGVTAAVSRPVADPGVRYPSRVPQNGAATPLNHQINCRCNVIEDL